MVSTDEIQREVEYEQQQWKMRRTWAFLTTGLSSNMMLTKMKEVVLNGASFSYDFVTLRFFKKKDDDLETDETIELTQKHYDMFVAEGCEPNCHICDKDIKVGNMFQLRTIHEAEASRDTVSVQMMVCVKCVDAKVPPEQQILGVRAVLDLAGKPKKRKFHSEPSIPTSAPPKRGKGCFIVNGQIVT